MNRHSDFLIIGGGIIGLSLAQVLGKSAQVTLIEKDYLGAHASTHNSAVIHGGIYYPNGSLKSKYWVRGNKLLTDFWKEHAIRINNLGKIIAPRDNSEIPQLEELYDRAVGNGAEVKIIDYHEAKEIEPRIVEKEKYIWSPRTSVADNLAVIKTLEKLCVKRKVNIRQGCMYMGHLEDAGSYIVQTQDGQIRTKYIINWAGAFADIIAKDFDVGLEHQIFPFQGKYRMARDGAPRFNTLVYAVPISRFLGAHTTNTISGDIKLGPTAIPSINRDNYQTFMPKFFDFFKIFPTYLGCLRSSQRKQWIDLLREERRKMEPQYMVDQISKLVTGVTLEDYDAWGASGIHANLFDLKTMQLATDFHIEQTERSWHFLNPCSPGWTSALAVAEDWNEKLLKNIK